MLSLSLPRPPPPNLELEGGSCVPQNSFPSSQRRSEQALEFFGACKDLTDSYESRRDGGAIDLLGYYCSLVQLQLRRTKIDKAAQIIVEVTAEGESGCFMIPFYPQCFEEVEWRAKRPLSLLALSKFRLLACSVFSKMGHHEKALSEARRAYEDCMKIIEVLATEKGLEKGRIKTFEEKLKPYFDAELRKRKITSSWEQILAILLTQKRQHEGLHHVGDLSFLSKKTEKQQKMKKYGSFLKLDQDLKSFEKRGGVPGASCWSNPNKGDDGENAHHLSEEFEELFPPSELTKGYAKAEPSWEPFQGGTEKTNQGENSQDLQQGIRFERFSQAGEVDNEEKEGGKEEEDLIRLMRCLSNAEKKEIKAATQKKEVRLERVLQNRQEWFLYQESLLVSAVARNQEALEMEMAGLGSWSSREELFLTALRDCVRLTGLDHPLVSTLAYNLKLARERATGTQEDPHKMGDVLQRGKGWDSLSARPTEEGGSRRPSTQVDRRKDTSLIVRDDNHLLHSTSARSTARPTTSIGEGEEHRRKTTLPGVPRRPAEILRKQTESLESFEFSNVGFREKDETLILGDRGEELWQHAKIHVQGLTALGIKASEVPSVAHHLPTKKVLKLREKLDPRLGSPLSPTDKCSTLCGPSSFPVPSRKMWAAVKRRQKMLPKEKLLIPKIINPEDGDQEQDDLEDLKRLELRPNTHHGEARVGKNGTRGDAGRREGVEPRHKLYLY